VAQYLGKWHNYNHNKYFGQTRHFRSSFEMCGGAVAEAPPKGLELTAYSVRSFLAPASSSSSGLAFGAQRAEENT